MGPERVVAFYPTRPQADTLKVLEGTLSDPFKVRQDDHERLARIVVDGSGFLGLQDYYDNRDWAGINKHVRMTARVATYLAEKMQDAGYAVEPGLVLQAHLVSHPARRRWDEAGMYPNLVPYASIIREIPNEVLGTLYLIDQRMPKDIVKIVAALVHGYKGNKEIYDTWEYKLASYADHRITQNVHPLNKRMADFFINDFTDSGQRTNEMKTQLYAIFEDIVQRGRSNTTTLHEAANIVTPYQTKSSERGLIVKDFMHLVLEDAATEAELINIGINPEDLTDNNPPPAWWERYLERLYINDAEKSAFRRLDQLGRLLEVGRIALEEYETILEKEFPSNHWWGQKIRKLYEENQGKPYVSAHGKPVGTERAIAFFANLDQIRREKKQQEN